MMTEGPPDLRETRRRQILTAAAQVFARAGFEATRIHDIAQQAGVAYGLVYHYFGSKQDLLDTVFDESWAAFADAVEGIAASARPPRDRVRAVLDYLFGAWDVHGDVVRVVVTELGPRLRAGTAREHPHVSRALRAIAAVFDAARADGSLRPDLDPAALAWLFMGALEGAFAAASAGLAVEPRMRDTLRALFRDAIFHSGAPAAPTSVHPGGPTPGA